MPLSPPFLAILTTQFEPSSSVWSLFLSASPLALVVLLGLLAMSVVTWAIVFLKRKVMRDAEKASSEFARAFEESKKLSAAEDMARSTYKDAPPARVLLAGCDEARREKTLRAGPRTGPEASEAAGRRVERALRAAVDGEAAVLERRLTFLATTASTAPFIGLFGTVWGILTAFHDIGAMRSADLAVVAPGIAEALVATAVGLFAAIPAVMAYNAFAQRIRTFRRALDSFADAALSRIEREWPE